MNSKPIFLIDVEYIAVLLFVLNTFFYPISAIISSFLPADNSIINIVYRFIVLFLSLYLIFLHLIIGNISLRLLSFPLFLFLLYYLYRIIWDTIIEDLQVENSLFQLYSFFIGGILMPALAISLSLSKFDYERTLKLSFWVLFISNLLMLLVYLFQKNWEFNLGLFVSRAQIVGSNEENLLLNPISYGIYSGYLLVISFFILLYFQTNGFVPILFSKLALFIGLLNLLLSTSRGPFVFTLISFLFLFCIYFFKKKNSFLFYVRFVFFILISLFFIVFLSNKLNSEGLEFGIIQRLMSTKESLEKGYVEERNELYSEGVNMFLDSPFFGKSIVLESTLSYPHNSFIEVLMATGLFGMFLYLLIFLSIFINTIKFFKKSNFLYLFLSLFMLSFGISLTSGNLYQSVDNWSLITLLLGFKIFKNQSIAISTQK